MKFGLSARSARRPLALIASAALAACDARRVRRRRWRRGQDGGDAGSATSGTVNWWGWTPTDTATAKGYIAAFNKEYPDIKVNYKLVAISDWQAALPPALRSDGGPDVFDMQPGAYVSQVQVVRRGPHAGDDQGARRRLEVQGRAGRRRRAHRGRQVGRHVGGRGLLRDALGTTRPCSRSTT